MTQPAAAAACAAAPAATHAARVQCTEEWVKACLAGHDSSHDWWHVERVRNSTVALGRQEGLQEAEQQLAELAALLHDVADHKYSSDPEADRAKVQAFMANQLGLSDADQATVLYVIDSMGFNAELGRQQAQQGQEAQQAQRVQQQPGSPDSFAGLPVEDASLRQVQEQQQGQGPAQQEGQQPPAAGLEPSRQRILAVVQDADRLDAIGAIGIARCLTFGGRFNRVLHDPAVPPRTALTREQYTDKAAAAQQTTINHFPEKLLRLKELMRTRAGRAAAEGRHAYMEGFLQQFHAEWRGDA